MKTVTITSLIKKTPQHALRAAIDLQHSAEDNEYITEQQIDNF